MDCLFILGTGSLWKNNELRYALRSLEKFGKNLGRVFVTGENPGFLSPEVVYNYQPDPAGRTYNHAHKVLWTCENTDISDDFLCNYDDNFLLAPVDLETYPFFCHPGELPKANVGKSYNICLHNTRKFLEKSKSPSMLHFGIHAPIRYNKEKFIALKPAWEECRKIRHGLSIRSIYANMTGAQGTVLSDCKLKHVKSRAEIEKAIAGRPVFSIHDRAVANGCADLLRDMFPKPSRFETGDVT